jgi:two-component system, NtrC family, response regulator AtoC
MTNVLIVDDEENIREIIKMTLRKMTDHLFTAGSAEEGLEILKENLIDVVISDIKMPGMDGLAFLKKVKEEQPAIQFLMITAHGSMDTVVEALRLGASDFLSKPFENKILREQVGKLLKLNAHLTESIQSPSVSTDLEGMIGRSPAFKKSVKRAMKSAPSDSTILITGESGTGKEVFARAIHENSMRQENTFVAVNCGALPENLMESELFGYEKGAFTGAISDKPGKFEIAHRGTLFLDEVGEMPLSMQVKLLRALQEKAIDRLGGTAPISVDFRLIAATNKDLEKEIEKGNFREDLYYRLNIIPIELPPLRERGDDVKDLAVHFLKGFNQRYDESYRLNVKQMRAICHYQWKGNIRELENIIERAVVLGDGLQLELDISEWDMAELLLSPDEIKQEANWVGQIPVIQSEIADSNTEEDQPKHKKGHKIKLTSEDLKAALDDHNWNKSRTAETLGISRRGLLYKIKEYELQQGN